jgi:mono/diheme cytochrome c family protein
MAIDLERLTPVEEELKRQRWRYLFAFFVVLFIVGTYLYWRIVPEGHEEYTEIAEHFKYGSIGADNTDRGVPFWLWKVLPEMFPRYLPDGGKNGYASLGLIQEEGKDRPVGFSQRRVLGLELVGLNCAVCHTGRYRETPGSDPVIVMGMPANTVDLQGYFQFLFDCASDSDFLVEDVMDRIRAKGGLDWYQRLVYPRAIRAFRTETRKLQKLFAYWKDKDVPRFGPGRIDTFNPYITLVLADRHLAMGDRVGVADFPSLWNQRPRVGMELHWDGNNDSVEERNISAAIGAGVRARRPTTLDVPSMKRIADWIMDFSPPPYPRKLDDKLVETGRKVFHKSPGKGKKSCADCHALDGNSVGKPTPIEEVGTDRHRLDSFTAELADAMNTIGEGYPWRFQHFKKTNGYANMPLDGIWLRAPYLHNGSVPTLWELLEPKARRTHFFRGDDVYDWERVGFRADVAREKGRTYFPYDTTKPGNGNGGHLYGSELSVAEKKALLEFLKSL